VVATFRDQTGRPGPSTWQLSNYPEGQENYLVTGVKWYEVAAYADFVGKGLPKKKCALRVQSVLV